MLHGQDLLGDGVNVAARLQTATAPGGICISGSVHDQIRNKLSMQFQSLGEMSFKNIQQPVRTFSITESDGHGALPSPKPRRIKKGPSKWIAAGAAAIIIAAAGAGYFLLHKPAAKLTEKDTIVLADFTNTTGDPVFDGTLRQGLSAQLEQSPFLSLISDERISQMLALMSQPKDARLTKELTREVCQRTASAAAIEGSISSLGSQFVLGLKAMNCHTGDLLAQEQVTANGKEQVLKVLGDAATKLREKLGESLDSVQKYDTPLENVTTPSLEALQAYSLGQQAQYAKSDHAGAIPFYRRAIGLDPDFAMAYDALAISYFNLGESARASESIRQAFELRGRTSEREKLNISAVYAYLASGDLEAARSACELWWQTYPRDDTPHVELFLTYVSLGKYEGTLTSAQEALRLNSRSAIGYGNLVLAYQYLNRLDEARATALEAPAHNLDAANVRAFLYELDFLHNDAGGMEREAAGLIGKQGWDDYILYLQSDTAAYGGEFAKARELTHRAVDSAQRANEREGAAIYRADAAVREALLGNLVLAKQEAQAAVALASGKDVEGIAAVALGQAGDSAQAEKLGGDLSKRFPDDTIARFQYLPMIHATADLRRNDTGKAVEALAVATPYEMGSPAQSVNFALYPVYLRGEAYLAAKQGAAAEVEFQKILDHPGVVVNEAIGALAHLGLGRAHALSGDRAKAKTAYQDFLALWKNADPDIPILNQAKAEYAKLK